MKSSYKVINLADGSSTYTIGPNDGASRVLLSGGTLTLTKNIAINWETGNSNAPQDTCIFIHKTASISLSTFALTLFGYSMPKDIAVYADMIVCVKISGAVWKITGFTGMSFLNNGGIGIIGGGGIDPTEGLIGFPERPLGAVVSDLVDNNTMKVVGGKIVGNFAGDNTISLLDDFIDETNKTLTNAALTGAVGGTAQINAITANSYEGSVGDKLAQIKIPRNPCLAAYLRITARGNSTIKIGVVDDFTTPTRGAYFKLSTTSFELFTVVNDGTERILTTGITLSLATFYKMEVCIQANGDALFYVNNVLVREETSYAVPDEAYGHSVSVVSGSADTVIEIDYMRLQMNRS